MRSEQSGTLRTRIGALAFVFVVLSLAALLIVPPLIQRRIDGLRERGDEPADQARTLVTESQFQLARQMAALRGYVLTGDEDYLRRHADAVALEEESLAELRPLAERLGPEVLAQLDSLQRLSERWRREVEAGQPMSFARDTASLLSFDGSSYAAVHGAAAELDRAVAEAAQVSRDLIRAAEDLSLLVTAGLALLALASAAIVAWLGHRVRRLAEEAEAQRHEAERALQEARRVTAERNRLIRGITHDVKNPLGAADGYASLLEMRVVPLEPRQAEWVAGVRRSIHGALGIIDDLLNLARAESEDLPIERAPVALSALVREAVEDHRGAAEVGGHALELRVPEHSPVASTDSERVRQILGNLLSNAIKYTPAPGRISIEVARVEASAVLEGREWARIRVADNGPGIPPEERERIFEDFYRLHPGGVAGHGLGLSISRRIARLLGGEITVESTVGRGSTFSLWIPLEPGEGPVPGVLASPLSTTGPRARRERAPS